VHDEQEHDVQSGELQVQHGEGLLQVHDAQHVQQEHEHHVQHGLHGRRVLHGRHGHHGELHGGLRDGQLRHQQQCRREEQQL